MLSDQLSTHSRTAGNLYDTVRQNISLSLQGTPNVAVECSAGLLPLQKISRSNLKEIRYTMAGVYGVTCPILREKGIIKGKGKVIPLQARCGPEGGYRYSSALP